LVCGGGEARKKSAPTVMGARRAAALLSVSRRILLKLLTSAVLSYFDKHDDGDEKNRPGDKNRADRHNDSLDEGGPIPQLRVPLDDSKRISDFEHYFSFPGLGAAFFLAGPRSMHAFLEVVLPLLGGVHLSLLRLPAQVSPSPPIARCG
jgi:hypothetical protein